ncbi:MAG: NADP-dependent oxidoreductase [Rubrivivax sp.]|nr:NADP-dependent oxidoreductase [Rubrivivax sp.]
MSPAIPQVRLRRTPQGTPQEDDFELAEAPLDAAVITNGHVHVRVLALSLDPYLRSAMAGRHLSAPILPGEVVRGEGLVEVIRSSHPRMAPGSRWVAACGWQTETLLDEAQVAQARPVAADLQPPTLALGVMGMPGLTAWAGLRLLAGLPASGGEGRTVLVSAASGPVGSTVGQLARASGCRVVGIAGGPDKCRWVREQAGFDACIDHRQADLRSALKLHCPQGIDVYFDNVGGDVLQAACEQLALQAQVVLCGLISQYGAAAPAGPNPGLFIRARATVRGLVVYDHWRRLPEAQAEIGRLIAEGRFAVREDLSHGLAAAPAAFCRLMRGENQGKALVLLQPWRTEP